MTIEFRGNFDKLKKCVSRTGLDGSWKKLPNGRQQYITDDHVVLNWAASTGRVWLQGEESAAAELKRKFKAAAKGRIRPACRHAKKSPEEEDVGNSDNRKTIRRLSEQLERVGDDVDGKFSAIAEQLEDLEEWMRQLMDHVGVPDWTEICIAEHERQRLAATQHSLDTSDENECSNVIDIGTEGRGRAPIGD